MIEYNEYLQTKVQGKEALIDDVKLKCQMRTTDIPYYTIGLDINLFTYESPKDAIEQALIQYNPTVTIEDKNVRVNVADVVIDVGDIIKGVTV